MANKKKEVYKPKPMTEGKRNIIQGLLQEYDIETAEDVQNALKDLLSGTLKEIPKRQKDISNIENKIISMYAKGMTTRQMYLATFEAAKKWTMPVRNWGKIRGELMIMYPGRMPDQEKRNQKNKPNVTIHSRFIREFFQKCL